jgi:hypothetical protein
VQLLLHLFVLDEQLRFAAKQGSLLRRLVFHIERGQFGQTSLHDLAVALVFYTPEGPMSTAPWSAGLIIDERANDTHREALTKIFSGQAGGPLASLAPIITNFLCVETRPIHFEKQGLRRSVSIPSRLDCVVEGFANPLARLRP